MIRNMQGHGVEISEVSRKQEAKQRKVKIFACIPAYNQEQSVGEVVQRALEHVDHVIVIDDGSFDRTAEVAESAGALVIRHPMNMGYGAAIRSGLAMALKGRADIVVTLDADLQHNPEDIPSLVTPILERKAEIVIGSRISENDKQMPLYRKTGLHFITKLVQYNGVSVKDAQSGFRAYTAKALRTILPDLTDSGWGLSTEILSEAGRHKLPIAEVPVVIRYDTGLQTSRKHPLPHGASVVYSILYYVAEKHPLLILGLPGIIFLCLGIFGLINALDIFNKTRQVTIGISVFTIGATVIGVVLLVVSVILAILSKLSKRISDLRQDYLY